MKPKLALLAIVPIVSLFVWAREAASWRPKTISKAQFEARLAPGPLLIFFDKTHDGPMQRLAAAKGYFPRAYSLDGKQLLVGSNNCRDAAILSPQNGRVLARLTVPPAKSCEFWGAPHFSADGRWVSFSQNGTATHVFATRTGQHLWSSTGNNILRFSPDSNWAACSHWQNNAIDVRDVATGRTLRHLTFSTVEHRWNFSRDGDSLLIALAPGQYRQLRLR